MHYFFGGQIETSANDSLTNVLDQVTRGLATVRWGEGMELTGLHCYLSNDEPYEDEPEELEGASMTAAVHLAAKVREVLESDDVRFASNSLRLGLTNALDQFMSAVD